MPTATTRVVRAARHALHLLLSFHACDRTSRMRVMHKPLTPGAGPCTPMRTHARTHSRAHAHVHAHTCRGFIAKSFATSADACRELFFSRDLPQADLLRYQAALAACSPTRMIDLADMNKQVPLPAPPAHAPKAFVLGGEDDCVVDVEAVKVWDTATAASRSRRCRCLLLLHCVIRGRVQCVCTARAPDQTHLSHSAAWRLSGSAFCKQPPQRRAHLGEQRAWPCVRAAVLTYRCAARCARARTCAGLRSAPRARARARAGVGVHVRRSWRRTTACSRWC